MARLLLICCTQPFAQYRNPFTFFYAQTFPLPPKSTIIGMLQNATNRYYDEKFWDLEISVHGGFESVFWNYSNMIKGEVYLKDGKLLNKSKNKPLSLYGGYKTSQRTPVIMQELYNGHLWIFIRDGNGFPYWDELVQAMKTPNKVLSLGRTEDVIFIKEVYEEQAIQQSSKTIKKNLWTYYPTYLTLDIPLKNKKYPVYSVPVKVVFKNNDMPIKSKLEINKTTKRDSEFKTVVYAGIDSALYFAQSVKADVLKINEETFTVPVDYGWL
ncbi:MAG: CRISPR-associated protein Cas5 [Nitrososphaerota archaeon]